MRIALVDASRLVLKIISQLLESRGHTVHAFTDGPDVVDYINANSDVDALITSVELPSMSGLELCWNTRLLATCRRPIYIILMSSNYDRHKLTEVLDSGADDFIQKPVLAEELYARLRAAERIAAMQQELLRLATTDPLSGLLNRRAFFEEAQEISAKVDAGASMCVAMIDADHFKQVNDVHGHGTGDDVIRGIAEAAKAGTELAGRLGGEEFAILIAQPLPGAIDFANQLRLKIADLRFETSGAPLKITCSMGISAWKPGESIDDVLKRADIALYQAKQSGRNRVAAAESLLPGSESPASTGDSGGSIVRSAARGHAAIEQPHAA